MTMISIQTLRKLVKYNPETGLFLWGEATPDMFESSIKRPALYRCNIWNAANHGNEAFKTQHGTGYLHGCILGETYKAHRVAWALYYGEWPTGEVDHKNRIRFDNRIKNLRDTNKSGNQRNTSIRKDNTSGIKGVSFVKRDKRWIAQICNNEGRYVVLGRFVDKQDAIEARHKAEKLFNYTPTS